MIPFNYLGWLFKTFGPSIYPKSVQISLCDFLQALSPQASALDIGGGTGVMIEFAYTCRDDLDYTVVDPAEGMLKYTKEYIKTYKAHAEALPFANKSFDIVLMGESLHHFRDIDMALKETVRVLKNGGKLFIYDFDVRTFRGKSICRGEKLLGEPGNFFVPEELKKKLESYEFSVHITMHSWRYTVEAILTK